MDLEINETSQADKSVVLAIGGRLNAASAPKLKARLKQLVDGNQVRVILDLSTVSFMDSSGLAVLVSGLKSTREKGGWLKLAGMTPEVASIFKMTMLDKVFELYPNVDAATKQ